MLRFFYRRVLALHPPAFHRRFAEEMQSIFEQAEERSARVRLLADGLLSLARQWTLRPEYWHHLAPHGAERAASDGIPTFYTLDPFRPRTAAVVHGLVLTVAVFCLTCFAIRYSWIHVLHVRIPEVEFESPSSLASSADTRSISEQQVVSSGSEGWTKNDAALSFSSSSEKGAPSRPPISPAPQSQEAFSQPAPPGRAAGGPAQAGSAMAAVQHDSLHPAAMPEVQSQVGSGASAEEGQAGAVIQPSSGAVPTFVEGAGIDAAERHRVIEAAVADLTRYYLDPDLALKMAAALKAHEKSGDDDAATDGAVLANLLTRQMRSVSHDRHVEMVYGALDVPENPPAPTAADVAAYRREMERTNCTFEKVQVLAHNVGYLKFNSFPDAEI